MSSKYWQILDLNKRLGLKYENGVWARSLQAGVHTLLLVQEFKFVSSGLSKCDWKSDHNCSRFNSGLLKVEAPLLQRAANITSTSRDKTQHQYRWKSDCAHHTELKWTFSQPTGTESPSNVNSHSPVLTVLLTGYLSRAPSPKLPSYSTLANKIPVHLISFLSWIIDYLNSSKLMNGLQDSKKVVWPQIFGLIRHLEWPHQSHHFFSPPGSSHPSP